MTSSPAWRRSTCSGGSACNTCGRAVQSLCRSVVLLSPHWPISVPKCSTHSPHQNGTLYFEWKCLDRRHAKMTNFVSGFEPNGPLFSGNDLEFILVTKNTFQRYIICLCLNSFIKSHVFRDSLWKCQFKFCIVLRAKPIETRSHALRSLSNSFRYHKSNNSLKIGKRDSVENHVFQWSTIASICIKFQ